MTLNVVVIFMVWLKNTDDVQILEWFEYVMDAHVDVDRQKLKSPSILLCFCCDLSTNCSAAMMMMIFENG